MTLQDEAYKLSIWRAEDQAAKLRIRFRGNRQVLSLVQDLYDCKEEHAAVTLDAYRFEQQRAMAEQANKDASHFASERERMIRRRGELEATISDLEKAINS